MEKATTIKLSRNTKDKLKRYRETKAESFDEIINKLAYIVDNLEDNEEVSKETIRDIKKARERIRSGNFLTEEEEAEKRLGL